MTALHHACQHGHLQVAERLVSAKADPSIRDDRWSRRLLLCPPPPTPSTSFPSLPRHPLPSPSSAPLPFGLHSQGGLNVNKLPASCYCKVLRLCVCVCVCVCVCLCVCVCVVCGQVLPATLRGRGGACASHRLDCLRRHGGGGVGDARRANGPAPRRA